MRAKIYVVVAAILLATVILAILPSIPSAHKRHATHIHAVNSLYSVTVSCALTNFSPSAQASLMALAHTPASKP